jgi:predicted TIM-barrel fold metal-dependent hydrolase
MLTRREWLAGVLLAPAARAAASWRPPGVLIDTHIHLFSADQLHFPYSARNAVYLPPSYPLERFVELAKKARLDHAVIVQPEPYQDDHRYLEYCLEHEPQKGFFKAACLFDPIDPQTPQRMQTLVRKNPGRIIALRIHEEHAPGTSPSITGPIRERDLRSPQMTRTWQAAYDLGLAIQLNFIPYYAPQIGALAAKFEGMPIVLDHLAQAGHGTTAEYDEVLRLAEFPRVYMKFTRSGVEVSSKQPYPHLDAKSIVKRTYQAFGADRMIWGGLGSNLADIQQSCELLDIMFDFAPQSERAKIRGLTAQKLFDFK